MEYFWFRLDQCIQFHSLQKIGHGWRPKVKLLSDYDIVLTEKIPLKIRCSARTIPVESNGAFLACPEQSVYIDFPGDEPDGIWVVHFSCGTFFRSAGRENAAGFDDNPVNATVPIPNRMHFVSRTVFDILRRMDRETDYRNPGYRGALSLYVLQLLHELYRCGEEEVIYRTRDLNYPLANRYIRQIIDYLHANYMHPIHIKDIENLLHLNYDYTNSIFKSVTGFPIMAYVDDLRMTRVRELLATTTLRVEEISQMVGIRSPNYLSKKFKKREHVSPRQFRRMDGEKNLNLLEKGAG